jgi:hypothetical protein
MSYSRPEKKNWKKNLVGMYCRIQFGLIVPRVIFIQWQCFWPYEGWESLFFMPVGYFILSHPGLRN